MNERHVFRGISLVPGCRGCRRRCRSRGRREVFRRGRIPCPSERVLESSIHGRSVYGAAVHVGDSSIVSSCFKSTPAGRRNRGRNGALYSDMRAISTGRFLARPVVFFPAGGAAFVAHIQPSGACFSGFRRRELMGGSLGMGMQTTFPRNFFQAVRGHRGKASGAFRCYGHGRHSTRTHGRLSSRRLRTVQGRWMIGRVEDDWGFGRGSKRGAGSLTAFPIHRWRCHATPATVREGSGPPVVRPDAVVFFPKDTRLAQGHRLVLFI
jgi:hypothetical protein